MIRAAIRPEVRAWARRWREVLAGVALCALGAFWLSGPGLIVWAGGATALIGAILIVTGRERARFRTGGEGPGIVRLDEGRLVYLGPETGGVIALRDLVAVTWDPGDGGAWHLDAAEGGRLTIPAGAVGSEALFDAFARLPGLSTGALADLPRTGPPRTIWQAPRERIR